MAGNELVRLISDVGFHEDRERFLEAKRGQAHRDATSFTDLLGD